MRRVDGHKPTQFFREEIAGRAGIDMQIGPAAFDERKRVADVGFLKPPIPFGNPSPGDPLEVRALTSWGNADGRALNRPIMRDPGDGRNARWHQLHLKKADR